jgi:hypothetical protein
MEQDQSPTKCDRRDACPDQYVDVPEHWNYCPNGLQVEVRGKYGGASPAQDPAQGYLEVATKLGVDGKLSGVVSEQRMHLARESNEAFLAAGPYATERFGLQTLGHHLERRFGVKHRFTDIPHPLPNRYGAGGIGASRCSVACFSGFT